MTTLNKKSFHVVMNVVMNIYSYHSFIYNQVETVAYAKVEVSLTLPFMEISLMCTICSMYIITPDYLSHSINC